MSMFDIAVEDRNFENLNGRIRCALMQQLTCERIRVESAGEGLAN